MMSLWNLALFLVVDSLVHFVAGQTNHPVTVGQLGSFYDPPTSAAGPNDTVTFTFLGPFHTVTQSSFDNPCLPLPGGFSSGVVGVGLTGNVSAPSWTLRITNASETIWFFCEITSPTSHCGSGMVGAINPPSQDLYQQFKTKAEAVSGTPTPSPTLILTGVGAIANGSPTMAPVTVTSLSAGTDTITATDTVTATPTPTRTPTSVVAPSVSSTKAHLGAILGGAIGGIFGIALAVIAILVYRRQRRSRNVIHSPISDDSAFFRYNPGPVVRARRPSEAFVAAKALENNSRPLSPNSSLSPNRRQSTPPGVGIIVTSADSSGSDSRLQLRPSHATLDHQASIQSEPGVGTIGGAERTIGTVNMQALANEVAAVLMRAPSTGTLVSNPLPPSMDMQQQQQQALNSRVASGNGFDPPAYRMDIGNAGNVMNAASKR